MPAKHDFFFQVKIYLPFLLVLFWMMFPACGIFRNQGQTPVSASTSKMEKFKITLSQPDARTRFGQQSIQIESSGRLLRTKPREKTPQEKKLSPAQLDSLRSAIKESDFFNQPDQFSSADRDVLLSFLELEMNGERKRISFKNELPPALKRLVNLMKGWSD